MSIQSTGFLKILRIPYRNKHNGNNNSMNRPFGGAMNFDYYRYNHAHHADYRIFAYA